MAGAASVAAAVAVFGYPVEPLLDTLAAQFKKKGDKVVDANRAVARVAYEFGRDSLAEGFEFALGAEPDPPERMLIDGNQALAYGALVGGCNFVAGYPMTPGTSVMEWLAGHGASHGVVVKHTEDEIAAMNMVIGAAHMGARAMTSTSGGGFALMVEALSLAGMTETPTVIVLAQRPGPSTGLATRTEQADLKFALSAGHGEFPRIVLAPGSVEECFEAGWRAFNLAERYQMPVIVLTEHYLATSTRTIDPEAFDVSEVTIDRGHLLDANALDELDVPYVRYEVTHTGISPRALPGHPGAVYTITGNEHSASGSITENAENRTTQQTKRLSKMTTAALAEMRVPAWHGPADAETTLVCWGGTTGPAREAAVKLNAAGGSVNVLQFADLWPLDTEAVLDELVKAGKLIAVEGNATGQWASVMRGELGCAFDATILKWDGRPFTPDFIAARVAEEA
jgi:2-oxoglutarate/2-oxoacid ferredoxin oxidoreductase subunit alpha